MATAQPEQQVTVYLRPLGFQDDFSERIITLDPLTPSIKIGRASKIFRHLTLNYNNAYVESPVMSREHAVLRLSQKMVGNSLSEECLAEDVLADVSSQLYIEDVSSMHGTYVGGTRLVAHLPYLLEDGAVVTFGSVVTRGDATFPARSFKITMHFQDWKAAESRSAERAMESTSPAKAKSLPTPKSAASNATFVVPEESSDEGSMAGKLDKDSLAGDSDDGGFDDESTKSAGPFKPQDHPAAESDGYSPPAVSDLTPHDGVPAQPLNDSPAASPEPVAAPKAADSSTSRVTEVPESPTSSMDELIWYDDVDRLSDGDGEKRAGAPLESGCSTGDTSIEERADTESPRPPFLEAILTDEFSSSVSDSSRDDQDSPAPTSVEKPLRADSTPPSISSQTRTDERACRRVFGPDIQKATEATPSLTTTHKPTPYRWEAYHGAPTRTSTNASHKLGEAGPLSEAAAMAVSLLHQSNLMASSHEKLCQNAGDDRPERHRALSLAHLLSPRDERLPPTADSPLAEDHRGLPPTYAAESAPSPPAPEQRAGPASHAVALSSRPPRARERPGPASYASVYPSRQAVEQGAARVTPPSRSVDRLHRRMVLRDCLSRSIEERVLEHGPRRAADVVVGRPSAAASVQDEETSTTDPPESTRPVEAVTATSEAEASIRGAGLDILYLAGGSQAHLGSRVDGLVHKSPSATGASTVQVKDSQAEPCSDGGLQRPEEPVSPAKAAGSPDVGQARRDSPSAIVDDTPVKDDSRGPYLPWLGSPAGPAFPHDPMRYVKPIANRESQPLPDIRSLMNSNGGCGSSCFDELARAVPPQPDPSFYRQQLQALLTEPDKSSGANSEMSKAASADSKMDPGSSGKKIVSSGKDDESTAHKVNAKSRKDNEGAASAALASKPPPPRKSKATTMVKRALKDRPLRPYGGTGNGLFDCVPHPCEARGIFDFLQKSQRPHENETPFDHAPSTLAQHSEGVLSGNTKLDRCMQRSQCSAEKEASQSLPRAIGRKRKACDEVVSSQETENQRQNDSVSSSEVALSRDSFPDAQLADNVIPASQTSSLDSLDFAGPAQDPRADRCGPPPAKRAKLTRSTAEHVTFFKSAARVLAGAAVAGVGMFAYLAASNPDPI